MFVYLKHKEPWCPNCCSAAAALDSLCLELTELAICAYTKTCSLLDEVTIQLPPSEYRDRLHSTYEMYLERIHLLNRLQQLMIDHSISNKVNDIASNTMDKTVNEGPMAAFKEDDSFSANLLQNNLSFDTMPKDQTLVQTPPQNDIQSSLDNVSSSLLDITNERCPSSASKRSLTMEYIRQFSLSDINLLSPIKYLFKPIKGIISPVTSLSVSPVKAASETPCDSPDTVMLKDLNNIKTEFTLQNIDLNDCKEIEQKQLVDYDNDYETNSINDQAEWPLLPGFFPPSPARSVFRKTSLKDIHICDNEYASKELPICEETHMAPFLKAHSHEQSDKSEEKNHQDAQSNDLFGADIPKEKINISTSRNNVQSYQKSEGYPYEFLCNNSNISFNFSDKKTSFLSSTPLLSTSLNIPKYENMYSSFIHKNISSETIVFEETDPIYIQKPKESITKTYWLMKIFQKILIPFINKSKGFYLTPRLFIPKDIWYVKDVKIKGEEEKIRVCESLILSLNKIKSFKQDDFQSLIKELSYLDDMVNLFRFWLLKKFGTEVVEPKKKLGVVKITGKSKFLIKNLPPEKINTSKYGVVQFDGPRKMYLTSIYRLFESSQVIGQLLNSLDLHELPINAQDHIYEMLKNITDFFENVLCHFVLVDINMLLDHFLKQLLYGDDYNSIIGPY
ncbi:hypothetical protein PORY_001744 [Pneumocystis oryctolagi]|uniref:Uncharacterized protein n=1 Tax=Pneumocystis oryctolagi TaxID=42067 RepID=A0ACB7CAW6_9ASCO|nr:hypothetical protein PORY_001744 [Pneumocystis oryctolagi]